MILHLIWRIMVDALAVFGAVVILAGLLAHFCIPDEHPPVEGNIEFNCRQDAETARLSATDR